MKVKRKNKGKFYKLTIEVETLYEHEVLKQMFNEYNYCCIPNKLGYAVSNQLARVFDPLVDTGFIPE